MNTASKKPKRENYKVRVYAGPFSSGAEAIELRRGWVFGDFAATKGRYSWEFTHLDSGWKVSTVGPFNLDRMIEMLLEAAAGEGELVSKVAQNRKWCEERGRPMPLGTQKLKVGPL